MKTERRVAMRTHIHTLSQTERERERLNEYFLLHDLFHSRHQSIDVQTDYGLQHLSLSIIFEAPLRNPSYTDYISITRYTLCTVHKHTALYPQPRVSPPLLSDCLLSTSFIWNFLQKRTRNLQK